MGTRVPAGHARGGRGHCGAPGPRRAARRPRTRAGARAPPPPERRGSPARPPARSDALQVRPGRSARAACPSSPPHPPDIKPTILCGSKLIPCRASRDMDLDVREIRIWKRTSVIVQCKRFLGNRIWKYGESNTRFRTTCGRVRSAPSGVSRRSRSRERRRQYRFNRRSVRSLLRRSLWFF